MGKATTLPQLRASILRAKNELGSLYSELAQATAEAMDEMAGDKADKSTPIDITIPTSGWQSDSTADYPSYFDINVTGVTVKDRASVDIKRASRDAAAACGLAYNETLAGKIRLRAASAPTEAIQAQYWIEQGKE